MAQICFEIPDDLLNAIKLPPGEIHDRLRRELAIRLYQKDVLSFGNAKELAQLTRWEFHDLLGNEGIIRRYDIHEFEEDLKTLKDLD